MHGHETILYFAENSQKNLAAVLSTLEPSRGADIEIERERGAEINLLAEFHPASK